METLNLEKFSPKKTELIAMANSCKKLSIKGIDDKKGYAAVVSARKELKKTRVQIEKDGKMLRAEAVTFQKTVIEKEKELVAIIEPTELELNQKQEIIDEEKRKIQRKESLPFRIKKLETIGVSMVDDFLLLMDDAKFSQFFNEENAKYLAEKERKMDEERLAQEKKTQEEKELAEKKAKEEQERLDAEKRKIEDEKRKIEDEKLAIKREKQYRIDIEEAKKEAAKNAKLKMERKAKEEAEEIEKQKQERVAKERSEKERLERGKKYKEFLMKYKYTDDENFYIQKFDDRIILFKRVGEFKIKYIKYNHTKNGKKTIQTG